MALDWNKIGSTTPQLLVRPRDIFAASPNKPWAYLRQEQGEALEGWFKRRGIGNHRNHNLLNASYYGRTHRWGALFFADMLLGGTGRADRGSRDEFLRLARQVIAAEGGQPPAEWTSRERSEPRPPYVARTAT